MSTAKRPVSTIKKKGLRIMVERLRVFRTPPTEFR
jgi:hypothetical protein